MTKISTLGRSSDGVPGGRAVGMFPEYHGGGGCRTSLHRVLAGVLLASRMTATVGRSPMAVGLALLLCFAPFLASLRSLDDPFGQTEEGVNAAIWALGGRNIRELGWKEARYGALVKPLWPQSGYIYAHHPPLPVWLSRLWLVFGDS